MKPIKWIASAIAAVMLLQAGIAAAHHGWRWTTGGNIELTGVITDVKLGMPHGVLSVDAEGETWVVEVGQPWRNERAGLGPNDLAEGVEIRIDGEPSANIEDKRLKAERIYLNGKLHDLYPGRD